MWGMMGIDPQSLFFKMFNDRLILDITIGIRL